ncbi:hypothetical protein C3L33_08645, partial [Rhododendron williamsianum]
MASSLTAAYASIAPCRSTNFTKPRRSTQIRCIGGKDPEGKPRKSDAEATEAFKRQIRQEKERRRALRQSRVVPDTPGELFEYYIDTEAKEIESEIARLKPPSRELEEFFEFFSYVRFELGQLRSVVSKTEDTEDRLFELDSSQKALMEGTEDDKLQADLLKAKKSLANKSLTKILTSKDVKATLLDMVERNERNRLRLLNMVEQNELNRSLLTLLDEKIVTAQKDGQKHAVAFMEKRRGEMLKYMTV